MTQTKPAAQQNKNMNNTPQSTDAPSSQPCETSSYIRSFPLLVALWVCFWFGNLLIAAPGISELLAERFHSLTAPTASQNEHIVFTSPPSWMKAAAAVIIATLVVVVTVAIRKMETCSTDSTEGGGTVFDRTGWHRVASAAQPRIFWLAALLLGYLSLHHLHQVEERTGFDVSGVVWAAYDAAQMERQPGDALVLANLPSPSALSFSLLWVLAACALFLPNSTKQTLNAPSLPR